MPPMVLPPTFVTFTKAMPRKFDGLKEELRLTSNSFDADADDADDEDNNSISVVGVGVGIMMVVVFISDSSRIRDEAASTPPPPNFIEDSAASKLKTSKFVFMVMMHSCRPNNNTITQKTRPTYIFKWFGSSSRMILVAAVVIVIKKWCEKQE